MRAKKKTKKRYESIRKYALLNPDMTQLNMARVFRVNQATISRALSVFDSIGSLQGGK